MDPIRVYAVALLEHADTPQALRELAGAVLAYQGPTDGRIRVASALLAAAFDAFEAERVTLFALDESKPETLAAAKVNLARAEELDRLYNHLLAVIGRQQLTDSAPLDLN